MIHQNAPTRQFYMSICLLMNITRSDTQNKIALSSCQLIKQRWSISSRYRMIYLSCSFHGEQECILSSLHFRCAKASLIVQFPSSCRFIVLNIDPLQEWSIARSPSLSTMRWIHQRNWIHVSWIEVWMNSDDGSTTSQSCLRRRPLDRLFGYHTKTSEPSLQSPICYIHAFHCSSPSRLPKLYDTACPAC